MDVLDAIRNRRSVNRVTSKPIPKAYITDLLNAAMWAPNHHFTEPWRFHVIANDERTKMSDFVADAMEREAETQGDITEAAIAKVRRALPRAPLVVVVTVGHSDDPVTDIEDYAAACCAIQNLLLAAWARGIASKWRTGDMAASLAAKAYLGVGSDDRIVGFIYLGYAAADFVVSARERNRDCISWLGWVDSPAQ